jgi:hypothetical protein
MSGDMTRAARSTPDLLSAVTENQNFIGHDPTSAGYGGNYNQAESSRAESRHRQLRSVVLLSIGSASASMSRVNTYFLPARYNTSTSPSRSWRLTTMIEPRVIGDEAERFRRLVEDRLKRVSYTVSPSRSTSDKGFTVHRTGTFTQNSVGLAINICITRTEAIFKLWVYN